MATLPVAVPCSILSHMRQPLREWDKSGTRKWDKKWDGTKSYRPQIEYQFFEAYRNIDQILSTGTRYMGQRVGQENGTGQEQGERQC